MRSAVRRAAAVPCAALVGLLTAAGARAGPPAPELPPVWRWDAPAGVEWAELVGSEEAAAILVATPAGQLHVVDAARGTPRLRTAVQAARGVRLAAPATAGDAAYCFDRHAVYALRLDEPAGLLWQHGAPPAGSAAFQDDPEFLSGWTAAGAAPAGVLAVDRAGQVVLLSRADGHVLWETALGPLPLAELHVRGPRAVVLWNVQGRAKAAFIALQPALPGADAAARPGLIVRDLDQPWPVWSTLLDEGLLTVLPARATLWTEEGRPRATELDVYALRAAAVDAFVPPARIGTATGPAGAATASAPAGRPLLLAADGPLVLALDVVGSARIWPRSRVFASGLEIETLRVRGEHFLTTCAGGMAVGRCATGEVLGYWFDVLTECVSAGLAGRRAYAVGRMRGERNAPLRLVRLELAAPASRPAANRPEAESFALGSATAARHVLWTGTRVVLVTPGGLVAYELP